MISLNISIFALAIYNAGLLLVLALTYLHYKRYMRQQGGHDKFDELYKKISNEIKYAVAPKSIMLNVNANDLVDLATEVWRIEQRLAKVVDIFPENKRKGLENSVNKLKRYILKYDIEIVDYTNQKYNDGLNLEVLSIEKDSNLTEPIVKETIEPTILVKGQVVRKAKIVLSSN
ncbi:hypothetical protein KBC89_00255 [Candidatus Woesebacteria bacterium]|nr:hypothetical protein [Candidatus Woesebacteria bacterium]